MKHRNVVLFIRDNHVPLGSDFTIFSDLKTLRGVRNRYKKHMENMVKRNCTDYIVVSYYEWHCNDTDTLVRKYPHYKLEVENNEF